MDLQTTKDFEDWLRRQPEPSPPDETEESKASYNRLVAKVKKKVAESKKKMRVRKWIESREEMEPEGERPNPGWIGGEQPGHK